MRTNGKHFVIVTVLVVLATLVTYVVLTAIYQLPVAASQEAGPIDQMFTGHFMMISFLFALIMVFMLYSAYAFRRRPDDPEDAEGLHFHGNTTLEVAWTIIPLGTVVAFGLWGAITLDQITSPKEGEMVVEVTGRQWSWVFAYPDYEDIGSVTELRLPVDRTIKLEMESVDVLHSFWVPEFRVKQDLVPGMQTTLRITPTEIGEYRIVCAEICGFDHARMVAKVIVMSHQDFDAWVAENSLNLAEMSPVERGQKWATDYGCIACHSLDGSPAAGPTWAGLWGREEFMADGTTVVVDEEYLRESILDPGATIVSGFNAGIMPANFGERFAADEATYLEQGIDVDILADLVEYLKTLTE
jgi:cytochrome c oxidase subunit II